MESSKGTKLIIIVTWKYDQWQTRDVTVNACADGQDIPHY